MSEIDRERGILSPADREYLRGEREFSGAQAERNARARIRDRVFAATFDLELLVDALSDRDRELVFGKRFDEIDGVAAFDALVAAVAFYYRATDDAGVRFEDVLTEAINVAEAGQDRAASVDLDVTYHGLSADGLRRKLRTGEELSLTEIAYLQRSEEVSSNELARHLAEGPDEVDDGRIQSKVTQF
ncbi:hypothetical protein SAMN04488067_10856 [Halorubrum xinjiangense]|uniref:Domain of unknown function domain-containing protein n=1 Tax=Halorubrum xinjiangense TaxID=261291 RepID=A0A1G7NRT4_9EURY|nr:hypothetical protein [Halorubrum xinjiangense]SDF75960.1 hypothetical protein SAMN04488067_10856 [Halorubrum xinjiangense]